MCKLINRLLVFMLGLLLCACSTSGQGQHSAPQFPQLQMDMGGAKASSLKVLPGCLAENPQDISLSVVWSEGPAGPIAEIRAANLSYAKAIYFSLPLWGIPASQVDVRGTEWAGKDALSLALPAASDELHVGIAMLHPQDRLGFSGETSLATISFSEAQATDIPTRLASAAPANEQSRINLDYDPASNRFSWYYRNLGDYDQNGEVNIADLTPIAIHFGKSAGGPFAEETIESVVDGDGNGEINIADVTPIGIGFGSRQDSFKIYSSTADNYPPQPTAPSSVVALQIVLFSASTTLPSEGRLHYSVNSDGVPDPAPAYWLRPVDLGSEGIPSLIAGNGNLPPVVSLVASQTLGIAPMSVTLDATGTFDPEGDPLDYMWLVYEQSTIPTEDDLIEGEPVIQQELEVGSYDVFLLVRDDDGAQGFSGLNLISTATLGWLTTEVALELSDAPGYALAKLLDLDLAEVGGDPWLAFAYETDLGGGRSGLVMGQGLVAENMDTTHSLDGEANVVAAEVQILPGVDGAHIFTMLNRLTVARISQYWIQDESTVADRHIVASSTSQKKDMSAALFNGIPAISFHNDTTGELNFSLADDASGATWPTPSILTGAGDNGEQSNLAIVIGAPVIVYFSPSNLRIRYVDSGLIGGMPFWYPPTTIKPLPGALLRDSLVVLPGDLPWLLVHDTLGMNLFSLSGAALSTENSISPTAGNVNDLFSTSIINQRVCIAWYDRTEQKIIYMRSTDELGTTWDTPMVVTSGLLVGAISLAEIDGYAAMAWFDGLQQTVHYSLLVE